jgi:hypothetical protein
LRATNIGKGIFIDAGCAGIGAYRPTIYGIAAGGYGIHINCKSGPNGQNFFIDTLTLRLQQERPRRYSWRVAARRSSRVDGSGHPWGMASKLELRSTVQTCRPILSSRGSSSKVPTTPSRAARLSVMLPRSSMD